MRSIVTVSSLLMLQVTCGATPMAVGNSLLEADLNGLRIALDGKTGGILGLHLDGPGKLLETTADQSGLVDLAYPVPQFEPLRLATRFSDHAEITRSEDGLTVSWDRLGASRKLDLAGKVSATATLRAAPDGSSIVMSCTIRNESGLPVRQVIFPDFCGLLPVAGEDHTYFKTGGFGHAPFRELQVSESDQFYAQSSAYREYTSGGMFSPMFMRWMNLGGLNGGFSLFPKRWGWEPQTKVLLHRSETTGRLRLMCVHPIDILPGETWDSGEWVLTPHRHGWAKGIEPYREWVRQNLKGQHPVPRHVRQGLGFRTVWMCQNQPGDPGADAIWRFEDLPELAREAKAHGLTEMVLWAAYPGFELPLPPPFPHLGTEAQLVEAVAKCREIGVNVAPFLSILQANRVTGPRYDLTVPETGGWTYHTELLPMFDPPYAGNYACAQVDTANPAWQADALAACRHLIDIGIPSISWDQFLSVPTEPNIPTLVAQVRTLARDRDPESTFSGEELFNIEVDCEYLDYTWNWGGYLDCQAFTSAFPCPRRNLNINRSVWEVKRGFLDNLYLNVWPTKPGGVNGSDRIENHPELSRALKQCAKLRAQFLDYFTEGTFVGYCILTEMCVGAHICAYVLPDRVLVLLTNEAAPREVTLNCDLAPWVPSGSGSYEVRHYDIEGALLDVGEVGEGPQELTTQPLQNLEITLYEFIAR